MIICSATIKLIHWVRSIFYEGGLSLERRDITQGLRDSPLSLKTIELHIGLPPYQNSSLPKAISVTASQYIKAEDLARQLAEKLGVNKNRWKLIIFSDNEKPRTLDKGELMKNFQSNKRLYYAPEIRVR